MELTIQIIVYSFIIFSFGFETFLSILNYKNRNAFIPEEVQDVYETSEYKKWQDYNMESFRFRMIVRTINELVFILLLALGGFNLFYDLSVQLFDDVRLQVLLFLGIYSFLSFLIGLYPSYYATFVIEEKYGFNKTTKKTFVLDKIKGILLTGFFAGSLIYGLQVLNEYVGDMFFLYAYLSIIFILLVFNIIYVRLIVPIFNKLTPLEDGELKDMIHAFAKKVGYEVTQISVMDASKRSSKLNAYFTGFGRFKRIVLYDTLIEKMSNEEIVAVLAHEIGHNKHKHIIFNLVQMCLVMLLYIGTFVLVLRNDVFSTAFGFEAAHFGFSIILFSVLLQPIGFLISILTSYLSRKHEYQADYYAAHHFSKKHIETALKVLSKENFSNLTPHPLYVKLKYSHPPVASRIKEIRKVEEKNGLE